MAIKKLSFQESRIIWTESLLNSLKTLYINNSNYVDVLIQLKQTAKVSSQNFDEHLKVKYGIPDDEKEMEWILIQIIELNNLILYLDISNKYNKKMITGLNESVISIINKYISEYEITSQDNYWISSYKPKETKTIIDNIQDIPEKIANPIKNLLEPNLSDLVIAGLVSMIYKEYENVKPDSLTNLNETDQNLYKNVWKFTKQLANNIDGAKGHKGKSKLSLKDIAHNYALNASLIQKLININNI